MLWVRPCAEPVIRNPTVCVEPCAQSIRNVNVCSYEVHTEGDSFTVAFHEVEDALRWCSTVQVRLQNMTWPVVLTGSPPPLLPGPSRRFNSSFSSSAMRSRRINCLVAGFALAIGWACMVHDALNLE